MFHVVDDTKLVAEVVSEILRKLGYGALEFHSPADYIAYANSPDYIEPRAVFTDATMPLIGGYAMTDTLSSQRPDLTFVLMSTGKAVRPNDNRSNCLQLAKPFRLDDIKNVINALNSAPAPRCGHGYAH